MKSDYEPKYKVRKIYQSDKNHNYKSFKTNKETNLYKYSDILYRFVSLF